jgi:hypothetical protein
MFYLSGMSGKLSGIGIETGASAASNCNKEAGDRHVLADSDRVLRITSLACEYYLALSTETALMAAEAISVSGVAFGTGKVNT